MKLNWEGIWESVVAHKKIIGIVIGLIVLLIVMMWMFAGLDEWLFNRSVRKDKEGIKQEVNALVEIEKEIANLETKREVQKERIQEATNGYAGAVNATDQQSKVIEAAVNKMQQAAESNKGNVNQAEFDRLLEDLR